MMRAGLRKRIRTARVRRKAAALEREFRRNQWLAPEALRAHQLDRLRALLDHAYRSTRYYRELFDSIGLRIADIRSLADFAEAVPPLEKSVLRERMEDLRSDRWRGGVKVLQTNGSTGIPVRFIKPKHHAPTLAIDRCVNDFIGIRGDERSLRLWGVDKPQHHVFSEKRNTHVFSFRNLPPGALDEIADLVLRWRPEFVWGYAGSVATVADLLESRGHTALGVRVVETFCETLHEFQRSKIQRVFGAEVFDHYGAKEFNHLGIECSEHDGLHLLAHLRVFELDQPVGAEDPTGDLLITNLYNEVLPLIRYRIGDTVTLDEAPCRCGRSLPRARIHGRSLDQLLLRDGTWINSSFLRELMSPQMVEMFILHQRSFDRIDCHVVPTALFGDDFREHLLREVRSHTRIDDVNLILAEQLDPRIAGKHRLIRSDVSRSRA